MGPLLVLRVVAARTHLLSCRGRTTATAQTPCSTSASRHSLAATPLPRCRTFSALSRCTASTWRRTTLRYCAHRNASLKCNDARVGHRCLMIMYARQAWLHACPQSVQARYVAARRRGPPILCSPPAPCRDRWTTSMVRAMSGTAPRCAAQSASVCTHAGSC